jgi:hypothetical protein
MPGSQVNVSVGFIKHRVTKERDGVEVYYHSFLSALFANSGHFQKGLHPVK